MGKGVDNLIGPDGKPLVKEPRLVVIKAPPNVKIPAEMVAAINQITGAAVIVMPFDSEVIMGKLALEELESMHTGIHAIMNIPEGSPDDPARVKLLSDMLQMILVKVGVIQKDGVTPTGPELVNAAQDYLRREGKDEVS